LTIDCPIIMFTRLLLVAALACFTQAATPFNKHFRSHNEPITQSVSDKAVFLTSHIEAGEIELAQEKSRVHLPELSDIESYAGYITINKTYNSNTFFWFFPSLDGNKNAPVLLWLNGGPGSTSMYGLFEELGPFGVAADGKTLVMRNTTWAKNNAMIFVDNPVGTGYSFTDDVRGYVRNTEFDVANDLYNFLTQFFTAFPQYQANDFYATGESYAGKYVPSITYKIHTENQNSPKVKINLKGMSVGDGMMHPIIQATGYGDLLYNEGMASHDEREHWRQQEAKVVNATKNGDLFGAFQIFDPMMNADFYPYPSYFTNTTGLTNYFNLNQPDYPPNPWDTYIALPSTRAYIHVGDHAFWQGNSTVEYYLIEDWFRSIAHLLPTILDNYKVMIYNGQLDIILSAPQCENFLQTLEWSQSKNWRAAQKKIMLSDDGSDIQGYVKSAGSFHYVVVRGAGHLLPQDQPQRAWDMINRFINDKFEQ